MLVLFLLFMLAICSSDTYIEGNIMHNQGLKNLKKIYDRIDYNENILEDGASV